MAEDVANEKALSEGTSISLKLVISIVGGLVTAAVGYHLYWTSQLTNIADQQAIRDQVVIDKLDGIEKGLWRRGARMREWGHGVEGALNGWARRNIRQDIEEIDLPLPPVDWE